MRSEEFYKWPEENFDDKVKREMAMPVWERPSMLKDYLHPIKFSPFEEQMPGMRIIPPL